jgi:hypothetical protein
MKENRQSTLVLAALALIALAAPPAPAAAQTPASAASAAAPANTRYHVTVVRLKPDMLNEWMDLQKNEVVPALKKAGVANRTVWSTVVGNSFEYSIAVPFEKFAAMDGPGSLVTALGAEAAARLNGKIRKCIETQRTYMANRVNDLTIPAGDALVSRMVVRRVPQGKTQEYVAFYRSEVFPALKKAKEQGKIAGAQLSIRGAGAQANEVVTIESFNKFADLDAGGAVQAVVGNEAMAAITAKSNALATSVQTVIRRRVADLSF